jgi:hypothetical protein
MADDDVGGVNDWDAGTQCAVRELAILGRAQTLILVQSAKSIENGPWGRHVSAAQTIEFQRGVPLHPALSVRNDRHHSFTLPRFDASGKNHCRVLVKAPHHALDPVILRHTIIVGNRDEASRDAFDATIDAGGSTGLFGWNPQCVKASAFHCIQHCANLGTPALIDHDYASRPDLPTFQCVEHVAEDLASESGYDNRDIGVGTMLCHAVWCEFRLTTSELRLLSLT